MTDRSDETRWNRIKVIFDAAVSRDPGERSGFLDEACGGDAALRAEVEGLLAADTDGSSFM